MLFLGANSTTFPDEFHRRRTSSLTCRLSSPLLARSVCSPPVWAIHPPPSRKGRTRLTSALLRGRPVQPGPGTERSPRAPSRRTNRSSRAKTAAATRKSETAPRSGTDVWGLKSPGTRPTPRLTPFAAGLEGLPRLSGHLPPRAAPKALLSSEDLAGGTVSLTRTAQTSPEPAPLQGQVEAPRRPFPPWEAAGRLPDQRL